MKKDFHKELKNLLVAACDGPLPEANQLRLEEFLTSSAEARRLWLSFARLHTELLLRTRADAVLSKTKEAIESSTLDSLEPHASELDWDSIENLSCDCVDLDQSSTLIPPAQIRDHSPMTGSQRLVALLASISAIVAFIFALNSTPSHQSTSDAQQLSVAMATEEITSPADNDDSSDGEGTKTAPHIAERQPRPVATSKTNR